MRVDHHRAAYWLAACFVLTLATFYFWPELDLTTSALFYREGERFWLSDIEAVQILRETVWGFSIAAFLVAIFALGMAALKRPLPDFGARPAAFVFLLYLLGPILLVNAVLKNHWGRARPGSIAEFGGTREFTPPWLPADECARNCSFVSGEGSAAVALAITFLILAPLARRFLPRVLLAIYAAAAIAFPVAGLVLRVATGRHFLSDTIFAALFVLMIALVLHRLILTERR
ncbi:MAG: phosphatase PAP2 family protein [Albidovulum sp.]|uniref:phosphatase PAP2 family protein n=1 Tax=Albidovulum sp. TaxID=1872424 RepID=UPI003CB5733C